MRQLTEARIGGFALVPHVAGGAEVVKGVVLVFAGRWVGAVDVGYVAAGVGTGEVAGGANQR